MMTVLFVACGLSIGGSLWLWNRGQAGWALALLMAGAFCLRLGIAQLDPLPLVPATKITGQVGATFIASKIGRMRCRPISISGPERIAKIRVSQSASVVITMNQTTSFCCDDHFTWGSA